MKYAIIIHKDKNSDYGVTVPDLSGCFSAGKTMDEALDMVGEAIECHLEGLILDKQTLPKPHPIEFHQKKKEYKNGIWAIVDVDLSRLAVKTKRINITMPENVIAAADKYARSHHISRSRLLTQAVSDYILEE